MANILIRFQPSFRSNYNFYFSIQCQHLQLASLAKIHKHFPRLKNGIQLNFCKGGVGPGVGTKFLIQPLPDLGQLRPGPDVFESIQRKNYFVCAFKELCIRLNRYQKKRLFEAFCGYYHSLVPFLIRPPNTNFNSNISYN